MYVCVCITLSNSTVSLAPSRSSKSPMPTQPSCKLARPKQSQVRLGLAVRSFLSVVLMITWIWLSVSLMKSSWNNSGACTLEAPRRTCSSCASSFCKRSVTRERTVASSSSTGPATASRLRLVNNLGLRLSGFSGSRAAAISGLPSRASPASGPLANSAGVGILGPKHIGARLPDIESIIEEVLEGLGAKQIGIDAYWVRARIHFCIFDAIFKHGFVLATIYCLHGIGVSGPNVVLLELLAAVLEALQLPWVVGGDWNFSPGELSASDWLPVVQGTVKSTGSSTCVGGEGSVIVLFVISSAFNQSCCELTQIYYAGTSPHVPVKMILQQARHSPAILEPTRAAFRLTADRALSANHGTDPIDESLFDCQGKASVLYRMLVPKLNLDLSTEFRNPSPDNRFELWRLLNRKLHPPRADWAFHWTNDIRKHARTSCADFGQTVKFIEM